MSVLLTHLFNHSAYRPLETERFGYGCCRVPASLFLGAIFSTAAAAAKEPIGGVWCCYCRRCSLLLQQEQRRPIIGTAAHSLLMFMVGMILRIECVTDEGDVFVMNEQNVSCAGIVFVLKHFPAVAYCTKLVQI